MATTNGPAVPPVTGNPVPAPPAPAPIPRRQTRFRPASQHVTSPSQTVPDFPVSQALPPIVGHADGYTSVEVPRTGLNTFIPSYINMAACVFITNQRLAVNDKFLKEQILYDPRALDLYCSFLFIYQTLRARATVGNLSASEDTLLSNLLREYPPASLPVPGTVVHNLMTITSTENPYSWLGNNVPAVPANLEYRAANNGYNLNNNLHLVFPNPLMLVAQLRSRFQHNARPTEAQARTMSGNIYNLAGAIVNTADPERFWLTTPHGRFPDPSNPRSIQGFFDATTDNMNPAAISPFVLDLPVLSNNAQAANTTLESYLGVVDAPGVANRRMQYLRWPSQLAAMTGVISKYVSGSRYLNDIPTTGLGANGIIARFTGNVTLENRDPTAVQGAPPAPAPITVYGQFHTTSFNAVLRIRDPVVEDLAVQIAMLAQTNLNIEDAVDGTGAALGQIVNTRIGDYWDYPLCEVGPESAVANILISHLANYVRSNPRRDASD